MILNVDDLDKQEMHALMSQTIIPRPIAWILSENEAGTFNLAPFSHFMPVCSRPPLLAFAIGQKPDGAIKDTRRNILERPHFTVHIASAAQVEEVNASSRTLPYGEQELDFLDLELVSFEPFSLPRIATAPTAIGCTLETAVPIEGGDYAMILGRMHQFYLRDDIVQQEQERLLVNAGAMNPLSRLGSREYATLGNVLHKPRPQD